jgi:hypothetical protein
MLTCREVSHLIASDGLAAATWTRRFSARLHLLMCRPCRRYERQLRLIGHSLRSLWAARETDRARRASLERAILQRAGIAPHHDHPPQNA